MNNKLITLNKIQKILEENTFHGFVCKKINEYKREYTFISIKWQNVKITVQTTKIKPLCNIVTNIEINQQQINTYKEFINYLKNLYNLYKQNKQKQYENNKQTK